MTYAQIRVFEAARNAPEWVRNIITVSDVLAVIKDVTEGMGLDDVPYKLEHIARERRDYA